MNRMKRVAAFTFSLILAGCGGGGGSDTDKSSQPTPPQTQEDDNNAPDSDTQGAIELATLPLAEGMGELIPPGVPSLN